MNPKEKSRAYFYLGVALHEEGKTDEAIQSFTTALDSDSKFPQALANLAFEFYQKGSLEAAIEKYEAALALKRDDAATWLNYGTALMAKHLYAKAADAYGEGESFAPEDPYLHYNRGLALSRAGKGPDAEMEFAEAERLFKQMEPQNAHSAKQKEGVRSSVRG